MKVKVFHKVNTFDKTTEEIIVDIDKIVYVLPREDDTAYIILSDRSCFAVEETFDSLKKLLVDE